MVQVYLKSLSQMWFGAFYTRSWAGSSHLIDATLRGWVAVCDSDSASPHRRAVEALSLGQHLRSARQEFASPWSIAGAGDPYSE